MNITIHRKCRDIDGAYLVRMIAKRAEMESKTNLMADQVVENLPSTMDRIVRGLCLAASAVLAAVVVIQVLKAVL